MEISFLSNFSRWATASADVLLLLSWLLVGSGMLLHFAPHTKRTLCNMWLLFIVSVVVFVAAHVLRSTIAAQAGDLLSEVCVLLAGIAIIRITTLFAFHYLLPRLGLTPPRIVEDLVSVAAYIAFGLIRLRYAGLELSQIVTTSAVLTGVVAFSMQDTLGNVLGGIALQLDNSLRIGEWIKVGDINGKITEIRWRSTEIETRNWETIVVPNSVLMRGEFIVLGRRKGQPEQWRRWIWFNVGYESAPSEVISVVNNAIRHADIKNVARDPAPNCVMMDFERLCGRYALRYWLTDLAVDDPTDSEVRTHIYAALKRHDIDPFVPESFRSIRDPRAEQAADSQRREIERRIAILAKTNLFAPLTDAERSELAPKLLSTPFMAGDHMTRQGADAHWLYIVTSGRAEVMLEKHGRNEHVGWIEGGQPGSYFGEMGLMTGATRSATVIARTDIDCLRLDKEAFASIVQSRPELAGLMVEVMEQRASGIAAGIERLEEEAADKSAQPAQSELVQRVREFFNL